MSRILELDWLDRLKLKFQGSIYLGLRQHPDTRKPFPFYLFRCDKHGLVENRPIGRRFKLMCPECTPFKHYNYIKDVYTPKQEREIIQRLKESGHLE